MALSGALSFAAAEGRVNPLHYGCTSSSRQLPMFAPPGHCTPDSFIWVCLPARQNHCIQEAAVAATVI